MATETVDRNQQAEAKALADKAIRDAKATADRELYNRAAAAANNLYALGIGDTPAAFKTPDGSIKTKEVTDAIEKYAKDNNKPEIKDLTSFVKATTPIIEADAKMKARLAELQGQNGSNAPTQTKSSTVIVNDGAGERQSWMKVAAYLDLMGRGEAGGFATQDGSAIDDAKLLRAWNKYAHEKQWDPNAAASLVQMRADAQASPGYVERQKALAAINPPTAYSAMVVQASNQTSNQPVGQAPGSSSALAPASAKPAVPAMSAADLAKEEATAYLRVLGVNNPGHAPMKLEDFVKDHKELEGKALGSPEVIAALKARIAGSEEAKDYTRMMMDKSVSVDQGSGLKNADLRDNGGDVIALQYALIANNQKISGDGKFAHRGAAGKMDGIDGVMGTVTIGAAETLVGIPPRTPAIAASAAGPTPAPSTTTTSRAAAATPTPATTTAGGSAPRPQQSAVSIEPATTAVAGGEQSAVIIEPPTTVTRTQQAQQQPTWRQPQPSYSTPPYVGASAAPAIYPPGQSPFDLYNACRGGGCYPAYGYGQQVGPFWRQQVAVWNSPCREPALYQLTTRGYPGGGYCGGFNCNAGYRGIQPGWSSPDPAANGLLNIGQGITRATGGSRRDTYAVGQVMSGILEVVPGILNGFRGNRAPGC
jgi:hypothetical protein